MRDGPAKVHKLGHFGYTTANFEDTVSWYTSNFNLVPTETLYSPKDESFDVAIFFRVDRGKTFSDHHCFLVARAEDGESTTVHHSSFEVEDIDTQFMGHQWLAQKGYDLVWGIGRHVHGKSASYNASSTSARPLHHHNRTPCLLSRLLCLHVARLTIRQDPKSSITGTILLNS
jgi:catechol 2,3-dioxygenase-like lactoylglutathione lyase family enzyme